jgi:putative pyrroloquinoline-quinone binding quinoprotein
VCKRRVRRAVFPGAALAAVLVFAVLPSALPAPSAEEGGILTFHGDAARTGWNSAEHTLTPSTVRGLHRVWAVPVEGEVYAEPLVVPGVAVLGRVRTVVYVVTEDDLVYALDAADGRQLWAPVSLGTPVPRASLLCGDIDPVGITSTPVLDAGAGTLYAVGLTTPDGGQTKTYRVAALDLKSGAMRPGWPLAIAPPPSSGLRFDAGIHEQRGALLFVRGEVFVPFGGYFGDCGDYHGWVVGVPIAAPHAQEAYVTPTQRMGGIWATGGPAADPGGNVYAATGNSASSGPVDFGNSVVRLSTSPLRFSGSARDYFTPSNFVELNDTDTDLGSTTPLVLPDQPGAATPHLLFIAGKQGVGYLINRDDMGGVSHGDGVTGEGLYSLCLFGTCQGGPPEVFSATAYWDGGGSGRFILVPGRGTQPAPCRGTGGVVALRLETAPGSHASTVSVAWCSPSMVDPGAPAVTSTGPHGALVWVVDRRAGILYALDALTGAEAYASQGADALGRARQFITPAVWGGRVYVGAGHEIVAYGLH